MGPLPVVALAITLAALAALSGCGQKGPLSLRDGQQMQRPPVRPVTSPAAPPALSPTDSPAVVSPASRAASAPQ